VTGLGWARLGAVSVAGRRLLGLILCRPGPARPGVRANGRGRAVRGSLVEVCRQRYNPDTKELETSLVLRIQCDRVEDGAACAVQIIAERAVDRSDPCRVGGRDPDCGLLR